MQNAVLKIFLLPALTSALGFSAFAQTPTFICQGSLKSGAAPAAGAFDFQFDTYFLSTDVEQLTAKICAPKK